MLLVVSEENRFLFLLYLTGGKGSLEFLDSLNHPWLDHVLIIISTVWGRRAVGDEWGPAAGIGVFLGIGAVGVGCGVGGEWGGCGGKLVCSERWGGPRADRAQPEDKPSSWILHLPCGQRRATEPSSFSRKPAPYTGFDDVDPWTWEVAVSS